MITKEERKQADRMLTQLENEFQKVVLVPAPDPRHEGHMIRQAENRNPDWLFGSSLTKNRKQLKISLNRIRFGLPLSAQTDYKVLEIIRNILEQDTDSKDIFIALP